MISQIHTTTHTLTLSVGPIQHVLAPLAAETEIEIEYAAEWEQHRPEPENGLPNGYRTLRDIDIRSITSIARLDGDEIVCEYPMKDYDRYSKAVRDDLETRCREHAVEDIL